MVAVVTEALDVSVHAAVAPARPPQLPALTGLRIFAAFLVITVHFGQSCLPEPLSRIAHAGALGVGLFFVLSGFILTYTYNGPDGRFRGTLRAYYVGRIARVYPIYFVGLVVALPALWSTPVAPGLPMPAVAFSTMTLTQAWIPLWHFVWDPPGWSLAAEAFFYMLFPFILPVFLRVRQVWLPLVLLACYSLSQVAPLVYHLVHPDPVYVDPAPFWYDVALFNPLVCLPAFLFGMVVGRMYLLTPTPPRWAALGLLTAVVSLVLSLWYVAPWLDQVDTSLVVRDGLLFPFFGAVIYCAAWGRGRLAGMLSSPGLVRLGEASYGVYILHWPIHEWMESAAGTSDRAAQASITFFIIYLMITVLLSLVIYTLIEVPARQWIRRWCAKKRAVAVL